MKATIDFPDELYRSVKARSAMEGRPLRSVAVELFQQWLASVPPQTEIREDSPTPKELAKYPWLAISRKYAKAGISHELDDIRESISRGSAAETARKLARQSGLRPARR